MRLILVAPCLAFALAAQTGCSSSDRTVVAGPPTGVTSLQARTSSTDDVGRAALLAADREINRLEDAHDRSTDLVTREALTWQIDTLQKRVDLLLDDMTSGHDFGRPLRIRGDVAALDLEVGRGVATEAWAARSPEAQPRGGNAETMPRSP